MLVLGASSHACAPDVCPYCFARRSADSGALDLYFVLKRMLDERVRADVGQKSYATE